MGDTDGAVGFNDGLADGAVGVTDGLAVNEGTMLGEIVDLKDGDEDGTALGEMVGNGPVIKAGANDAVRYGIIALAVWKSPVNIPMLVIPTAQLMPF